MRSSRPRRTGTSAASAARSPAPSIAGPPASVEPGHEPHRRLPDQLCFVERRGARVRGMETQAGEQAAGSARPTAGCRCPSRRRRSSSDAVTASAVPGPRTGRSDSTSRPAVRTRTHFGTSPFHRTSTVSRAMGASSRSASSASSAAARRIVPSRLPGVRVGSHDPVRPARIHGPARDPPGHEPVRAITLASRDPIRKRAGEEGGERRGIEGAVRTSRRARPREDPSRLLPDRAAPCLAAAVRVEARSNRAARSGSRPRPEPSRSSRIAAASAAPAAHPAANAFKYEHGQARRETEPCRCPADLRRSPLGRRAGRASGRARRPSPMTRAAAGRASAGRRRPARPTAAHSSTRPGKVRAHVSRAPVGPATARVPSRPARIGPDPVDRPGLGADRRRRR